MSKSQSICQISNLAEQEKTWKYKTTDSWVSMCCVISTTLYICWYLIILLIIHVFHKVTVIRNVTKLTLTASPTAENQIVPRSMLFHLFNKNLSFKGSLQLLFCCSFINFCIWKVLIHFSVTTSEKSLYFSTIKMTLS